MSGFNEPKEVGSKNIVGIGENADSQHFLLFPQCFLPFQTQVTFESHLFPLQMVLALASLKSCCKIIVKKIVIYLSNNCCIFSGFTKAVPYWTIKS